MNFLPCTLRRPATIPLGIGAGAQPRHGGLMTTVQHHTWHRFGGPHLHVGLRHKIELAGALGTFGCIVGAGAVAIWQAAATPWAASPVVPIPEPSSVAIFASGIAIFAGIWSNRRAKP
jgi:hypothetical protein